MSANFEVGIGVSVEGANKIPAFIKNLGDLANQHDKVKKSVNDTRNGVTKMVLEFNNLTKAEEKVVRAAIKKAGADAKAIKNADQLSAALSKLDTKIKSNEKAHESLTPAIKANDSATEGLTDAVNSSTVANDKNEKSTEKKTKATKEDNKAKKEAEREAKAQAKSERRLNEEYARQIIILNSLKAKIEAITKAHAIREAASKNFSSIVQNKIQQTSGVQAVNQQGVIAAQTNLAQTRHNNALLRQQQNHNNVIARMQQQHQNNLQRIAAQNARTSRGSIGTGAGFVGSVNSLPGVGKVIVYDALRRILTNIYQTVGKVGDEIVQWTKESIMFNDELARSKTVFQGFGLIGQKNADGTSMSLDQAKKNPGMGPSMEKIGKFSDSMMRSMTRLSIETGQDMEEIIASSRQLSADLINKKTGPGGKSPILDEKMGREIIGTTKEMVGLAAALKASDPGGRALKWHMVAVQELFSGSSGNSKDKGMANVKSMLLREGIRIKEKEALPITQAVNKGDIAEASRLIQEVLDRAGQSTTTFKNLMANSLMPNIDAVKTAFKELSRQFHNPLFDYLLESFKYFRETSLKLLDNEKFAAYMKKVGMQFRNAFTPILIPIIDFFERIEKNPEGTLQPYIDTFLSITKNFNIIFANFMTGVIGFFRGLLGVNSKEAFDTSEMIKFSEQFATFGEDMGMQLRKFTEELSKAMKPITENFFPAMIAVGNVFVTLVKIVNPFIRALSQLAYEIMNMPLIGSFIEGQLGTDRFNEAKNELYQKAYNNGDVNNPDMDQFGAFLQVLSSPLKLANVAVGAMTPGEIPVLDENGDQKMYPNGMPVFQSRAWAEFKEKTESNSGNREQQRQNRITSKEYLGSEIGKNEPDRRRLAFERVADMLLRNKEFMAKSEGGLLPGGKGYDGPLMADRYKTLTDRHTGSYDNKSNGKNHAITKIMPTSEGKRPSLYDAPKPSNQNRPNAFVKPGTPNDAAKVKAAEVSEKSINAIKNVMVKHGIAKVDEKGGFSFTKEHTNMLARLNTGAPTQKDLAFTNEYKETIIKTQTETKKETIVSSDLQKTIDSMNKSFNSQISKDGTPKVDKTREIIKQQPLVLKNSADPVNKMPTSVDLAMKMMQSPMSFYGKMTTPSKAPFDMPKPSIPKVNIAEDKGFVVVVGKMINDKISKTKEPITLKGNLSQTTNITISTVNVNSNDSKQFVEQLKGISQSKPTDKKQTEIPPGFKPSRGGN